MAPWRQRPGPPDRRWPRGPSRRPTRRARPSTGRAVRARREWTHAPVAARRPRARQRTRTREISPAWEVEPIGSRSYRHLLTQRAGRLLVDGQWRPQMAKGRSAAVYSPRNAPGLARTLAKTLPETLP